MPAYDYQAVDPEKSCEKCRSGFEDLHGMSEPGPETCPGCGNPVRRSPSDPDAPSASPSLSMYHRSSTTGPRFRQLIGSPALSLSCAYRDLSQPEV